MTHPNTAHVWFHAKLASRGTPWVIHWHERFYACESFAFASVHSVFADEGLDLPGGPRAVLAVPQFSLSACRNARALTPHDFD